MYDARLQRWERVKQKGLLRFVIKWGTVWALAMFGVSRFDNAPQPLPWHDMLGWCLVAGWAWGVLMYGVMMWSYKRQKARTINSDLANAITKIGPES